MITLSASLAAWGSDEFNNRFKEEVERLPAAQLPLQRGLALSSCVSHEPFKVMVIDAADEGERLWVKAGVFYSGIIAGCSCSDDPTPQDVQPEYCDLSFTIDKASGEATVSLL